ncbi:acyl-CoA dehydrogenase family protein [Nocardia nova]|uniref:acyl-CoA dehydrogenase family protein n=1 Tax=Nocardia nova TaxID=37330 RepID=UPI0033F6FEA9
MFDTIRNTADLVDQVTRLAAGPPGLPADTGQHRRATVAAMMATGLADPVLAPESGVPGATRRFCAAVEAIATHSVELAEAVQLQAMTANTVRHHAPPPLWEELGAGLRAGTTIAANCASEAGAGSDLGAIELTAHREGASYHLTGHKNWAAHAAIADELIVYARTKAAGLGGITAFLVPADAPGVCISRPFEHLRELAVPVSEIAFADVVVPAHRVLGRPHRGARVANILMTQGRIGISACAIGLGGAALTRATAFAGSRIRFGRPIIQHQGIGFPLADMATALEAGRQLLGYACDAFDRAPDSAVVPCAQAKLFTTDTTARITAEAVQVLGASAYLPGEPVDRWMRQAKLLQILQGTNQIQRMTVAASLATEPDDGSGRAAS